VNRRPVTRFHGFTIDAERRLAWRGGHSLHLTRKAFDLLLLLLDRAPAVITKDELHQRLWPGTFVTDSTVAGVIKELRRVLAGPVASPPLIRTVHGVGYAFTGTIEHGERDATGGVRCWLAAGERRVRLDVGITEMGRDPDVAVWIDSPDASRRHARIVLDGTAAVIEDLGSKNGTWINERPVTAPTPLQDGDAVRIGTTLLVFRVSAVAASTATAAGASADAGE
jgi:DNA-binding winged helix-turn-helix (wHTH) protein